MILSTIGKIKELVFFRKGGNGEIKFRTNLFRERKRDMQKAPNEVRRTLKLLKPLYHKNACPHS